MDVRILPRPFGCLWIPLKIVTLGLIGLVLRRAESVFARRLDDEGVETLGGRRIRWAEVTRVDRIRHVIGKGTIAEEVVFFSPKGRFSLHSRRMADFPALVRYALDRVPPGTVR